MTARPAAEGVRIRRATAGDCRSLCKIQVSAIRELGRSHYSVAEVVAWSEGLTPQRYEKAVADLYTVVAELNSQVVGFGTLDPTTGEVVAIYVEPQVARQGIGTALLEDILCEARRRGLAQVHCESSLCAKAFYGDAGFEAGSRCKHRFRNGQEIDCIPMTKSLE